MLLLLGFLLVIVGGSLILLMPMLWGRSIYSEYRDSRPVICPENQREVTVRFDAVQAAVTGLTRVPKLRLSDCTRWPERRKCGQECIPAALRAQPFTRNEVDIRTKRIYHLPILLAAFAGWCVGAIWHSHHLFRARWMNDLGLTPGQVKTIVLWYSPHLLSLGICLLFAYGVAWLLALVTRRRSFVHGILISLFLWGAVLLASLPSTGGISKDLMLIEASYTFLAAVIIGAIIGGLSGKLVLSNDSMHAARHADL